jgi:hypothetical protein
LRLQFDCSLAEVWPQVAPCFDRLHQWSRITAPLPEITFISTAANAVEAIKAKVRDRHGQWDEGALEDLLRAAVSIPSWVHADSEDLLLLWLPSSLSAILLQAT